MELDLTLKHRLDVTFFQIIELDPVQRKDLQQMWRNARRIWELMDQEMVNCRRIKKATAKYTEFEQQLTESLDTIERYITFGLLTK
jgi:hypothetical protein